MSYTKYLRWVLLGGLGLAFFIPFIVADGQIVPNMFFPFITGKNFAFRILVEVLFGFYALVALREPKYRPRASYLMWALGAFVVWVGVGTLFGVDPVKSFWGNFERMEGYITVLHLFVYFLILGAVASVEDWWDWLFRISVVSATLQAVYSLAQLLQIGGLTPSSQSGPRLDGTFGNAAYLGIFMLFNVFLTLFMLVRDRKVLWLQVMYGIAFVLQFATLFYTQTRGALLGAVGGLLIATMFIAWQAHGREWHTLRSWSRYALAAAAVLALCFFFARSCRV